MGLIARVSTPKQQTGNIIRIRYKHRTFCFGDPVKSGPTMQRLVNVANKVYQEAEGIWSAELSRGRRGCFKIGDAPFDRVDHIAFTC